MNIGQFANKALEAGKTAQETLDLVKKVFPSCKTSIKCIYYYASKNPKVNLNKRGREVNESEMKAALASFK